MAVIVFRKMATMEGEPADVLSPALIISGGEVARRDYTIQGWSPDAVWNAPALASLGFRVAIRKGWIEE